MLYIVESAIKIVAMGLISHYNSYLKHGWSYVDLFLISIGLLLEIPVLGENDLVRIIYLLRPLKMAYTTTAMRYIMTPWMISLMKMKDIFIVLLFILLTFSIAGVCAFQGSLFFRCRTTPMPVNGTWEIAESVERLCNAFGYGEYTCELGTYCGAPHMYGFEPDYEEVYSHELTFFGAIGFDNVGRALLACFQVITYDEWASIMYRMEDANGSVFSLVMFPLLVFVGSFFCLNLIVAVVVDTFQLFRVKLLKYGENAVKDVADLALLNKLSLREGEQSYSPDFLQSKQSLRPIRQASSKLAISIIKGSDSGDEEEFEKTCFSEWCTSIQQNIVYQCILLGTILINLLLLALNRKEISDTELAIMDALDSMFFILFFIEMAIGIGAEGFRAYLRNKQSLTDFLINLVGIIEIILTYSKYTDGIIKNASEKC